MSKHKWQCHRVTGCTTNSIVRNFIFVWLIWPLITGGAVWFPPLLPAWLSLGKPMNLEPLPTAGQIPPSGTTHFETLCQTYLRFKSTIFVQRFYHLMCLTLCVWLDFKRIKKQIFKSWVLFYFFKKRKQSRAHTICKQFLLFLLKTMDIMVQLPLSKMFSSPLQTLILPACSRLDPNNS